MICDANGWKLTLGLQREYLPLEQESNIRSGVFNTET